MALSEMWVPKRPCGFEMKKDFAEVIKGIKEGKRFKRPKWPDGMSFGENKNKFVRINLYGGEPWDLKMEDFDAKDWDEVKDVETAPIVVHE